MKYPNEQKKTTAAKTGPVTRLVHITTPDKERIGDHSLLLWIAAPCKKTAGLHQNINEIVIIMLSAAAKNIKGH